MVPPTGCATRSRSKAAAGAERVVRVSYQTLGNALRPGQYLKTYGQLFPELDGWGTFNPSRMVSAVWLPDGRSYKFYYNSYAELARVELPTGGATEYDHEGGEVNGTLSGVVGEYTMSREYQYAPKIGIYRRLKERRVYPDGVTLESLTRYGRGGALDGSVTVDHYPSATGPKIAGAKNYHYGSPITSAVYPSGVGSPAWDEGKEFKAESFSETDALLRRVSQTWQTGGSGPRVVETTTTLADVTPNLVSKVTHINPNNPSQIGYDQYNNPTDVWEYDYGSGAPGALLRRTHTDYLTAGYDTVVMSGGNPDALATVHLRGLATQQQVYDAAGVLRAQTGYEYDNYNQGSADNLHAMLTDRSGISGLASRNDTPPGASYSPTTDYPRGNVTKTTRYLLDASGGVTGSVSGYAQYDIAGNVVKTIDPRSTTSNIIATTFDFTDRFGAPNGEAQSNAAPSELSSSGQASYAFPTKVTNALGHIAYTQFDYFLGKAVDSEDANNVKSSIYYEDVLDRPTKSIVGIHATDTLAKRQTVFVYNDTGSVVNGYPAKSITTIGDRDTFGESGQQTPTGIKATAFYDGLGRTWRKAAYEGNSGGGNTWSVVETQFDALGRAYRACNPFRATAPDAALPASPEWTTTAFDALGRATSVTTPDGAHVDTAYSGNRVLVSDQAKTANSTFQPGSQRISETDALGRLKAVWEVRSPDAASGTEAVSFPGHAGMTAGYKTTYDYDALGNLVQVAQGAQRRWFAYDSLSRLIRARNPEQGTYAFTPAVSVSGMASGTSETNSSWSLAYAYDNSGNLTQRTDARNVTTTYTYDSLSRSTQVSYSDGTPTVQYQFDTATNGKGHLHYEMTAVAGGSLRSVDSYDALGRPLVQRQHFVTPTLMANGVQWLGLNWSPAYTVTRTYDRAGGVKTQTYPSGRGVTYTYNDAAQLSDFAGTLHDGTQRNYATGIKYTAAGQVAKETFGTQTLLYHNLHYNKRRQLVDNRLGTNGADEWTWNRAALINYYSLAAASAGNPFLDSADNNGNLIAQRHFVPDNDAITGYKVPQNDVYYY
jgi:YD repeat-containing protein